jgi:hypothetical protein
MNKSTVPIRKGTYHQELVNSIPKLFSDLIDIIFQYAKNENDHIEYYYGELNIAPDKHDDLNEIMILGYNLYIKQSYYFRFRVYSLKTYELLDEIYGKDFMDIYCGHITKYLSETKEPICSGYYPYNENLIKNFWEYRKYKKFSWEYYINEKNTYSDKYKFRWTSGDDLTTVINKETNDRIYVIKEKYQRKKIYIMDYGMEQITITVKKCCYDKNIMVYNNILYVIGYYLYRGIDGIGRSHEFADSYIHMYNANTFEFIREFTEISGITWNKPISSPNKYVKYMAVSEDRIIISLADGTINIWVKEECL